MVVDEVFTSLLLGRGERWTSSAVGIVHVVVDFGIDTNKDDESCNDDIISPVWRRKIEGETIAIF